MKNITLTRNGQTAPRDVETSTMHADGLAVGQASGTSGEGSPRPNHDSAAPGHFLGSGTALSSR